MQRNLSGEKVNWELMLGLSLVWQVSVLSHQNKMQEKNEKKYFKKMED